MRWDLAARTTDPVDRVDVHLRGRVSSGRTRLRSSRNVRRRCEDDDQLEVVEQSTRLEDLRG